MDKILKTFGKIALTIPLILILTIVGFIDLLQIDYLLKYEINFLTYLFITIIYFLIVWILSKVNAGHFSDIGNSSDFDVD